MNPAVLLLFGAFTFGSEFGVGADYATQAYTLLDYDIDTTTYELIEIEDDTLDVEPAGRTFWAADLGYEAGRTTLTLDNTFSFSTRSFRNALGLDIEHRPVSSLALRFCSDNEGRLYHTAFPGLADTLYSKDYASSLSSVAADWTAAEGLTLGVEDEFEMLFYAEPDSYSYDYYVNRVGVDAAREFGWLSSVDGRYEYSRRSALRSDDLDYDEHELSVGGDHGFDFGLRLGIEGNTARREYASPERSFWEEAVGLDVSYDLGRVSLGLDNDLSWTWYDTVSEVYTSLREYDVELSVDWQLLDELTVRGGPGLKTAKAMAGPSADDCGEWSATGGLDFFSLGRFWLSAEDRVGRRLYPTPDTTYQSDYWFNEFTLFLNWNILSGSFGSLELDGMVSISPEWHARETDDFEMGIYSLELKYGF